TATAASTALPPLCSTSRPMCVARFSWLTTIACWATTACAAANRVSPRASGRTAKQARIRAAQHAFKPRRSGRCGRPRPGTHGRLWPYAPVFMDSRFGGNDGRVFSPDRSRLFRGGRARLAVIDAVRPHVGRGCDPVRHVEEGGGRRNV